MGSARHAGTGKGEKRKSVVTSLCIREGVREQSRKQHVSIPPASGKSQQNQPADSSSEHCHPTAFPNAEAMNNNLSVLILAERLHRGVYFEPCYHEAKRTS